MNHLAIDLETLSLEPNAHILSIGAVFFDPATRFMSRLTHSTTSQTRMLAHRQPRGGQLSLRACSHVAVRL